MRPVASAAGGEEKGGEVTIFEASNPEVKHTSLPGTILLAYRGSIAHNLYVAKNDPTHIDDVDLMGFVVGEKQHYFGLKEWGSRGTKEFWEGHYDCVYYEVRKAVSLLLQGNPNIVSMLWCHPQSYLLRTQWGERLLQERSCFVGKHVYNAFAGYASAQLRKMESRDPAELREYIGVTNELKRRGIHPNHKGQVIEPPEDHPAHFAVWGEDKLRQRLASFQRKGENIGYMGDKRKQLVLDHGYDAKNAAHCIRLLKMCREFMADGVMRVYRTDDRDELLSIKRGEWPLSRVKEYAEQLFSDVKIARDASPLPPEPDYDRAQRLLIEIVEGVAASGWEAA